MKLNLVSEKVWRITNIEELFKASNIDPKEWIVLKQKINKREWQSKDKETSEVTVTELFQIFAELKPRHDLLQPDIKEVLFDVFWWTIPKLTWPVYKDWPLLWQIVHSDIHFDRIEHKGKKYLQEIDDRTYKLLDSIMKHKPDKLLYANLWDYWNSDWHHATTKGTPQEDLYSDKESFKIWLHHQMQLINTLQEVAPVEVVFISGNHDYERMQSLADALELYYDKTPNVHIDATPQDRKYKHRGNTTIWFQHWDGIKLKQIPLTMMEETKLWKENYMYQWHIHQDRKDQLWNLIIETVPSPAYPSARERQNWRTQRGKIKWQVFDKKKGMIAEYKQ